MNITITLGLPAPALSPNASRCGRSHWPRTKAKKAYRGEAGTMATMQMRRESIGHPKLTRATVLYCAFWKDRRSTRDPDNLIATMKPALDGLVDAGLLLDDDCVQIMAPVQDVDKEAPRIEIIVQWDTWDPGE